MSYTLPIVVNSRFPDAMSILYPTAQLGKAYSLGWDGSNYTLVDWELPDDPPDDATVTAAINTFDWNKVKAQQEVEREWTDKVYTRCLKIGSTYPSDFVTYDSDVEAVLSQTDPLSITWPMRPALPSGIVVP